VNFSLAIKLEVIDERENVPTRYVSYILSIHYTEGLTLMLSIQIHCRHWGKYVCDRLAFI